MEKQLQYLFYTALLLIALTLAGWGLARAGSEGLAFGFFAFLTLGGGLVCVWERSVVRSAFALMATFCGISGFFVLLHADFLAMAQLLIYVGGILALLLFGVMLSPPDVNERKLPRVLGALGLVGAAVGWVSIKVGATMEFGAMPTTLAEGLDPQSPLLNGTRAAGDPLAGIDNAQRIGVGFLSAEQYVVAFELAAVVLTVALVAAVYIARRKQRDLVAPSGIGGMGSSTDGGA